MFIAVYAWRVKPGKEEQFREGWRRGTAAIVKKYASFGSRLHREADGRFVGYAQWPDEASWRAFFDNPEPADREAAALFVDAMEPAPREPLMKLTVLDDMLVHP
jgi:heme-degrading monooxygenase HmoA